MNDTYGSSRDGELKEIKMKCMVLHCDLKNKTKIGQMIKLCRELRERSADADIFQMNNQKFKKIKLTSTVHGTDLFLHLISLMCPKMEWSPSSIYVTLLHQVLKMTPNNNSTAKKMRLKMIKP